jgi:hypothetical protein
VTLSDALIVSLAGIAVVFFGLLVTSLMISAISLVPAWIQRRKPAPGAEAQLSAAASAPLREAAPPVVVPPPAPAVLAVISALLDVEMRLHGADRPTRFTFRNDPDAHEWRGDAGMRSAQPIKGVR